LEAEVHVVREVLDKELLDREGKPMGRVDGMILQVGKDLQPRITHIAIGGPTLWNRVHPALARLARRMSSWWGPKKPDAVLIPWSRVESVGRDIRLDIQATDSGAIDWELWIARHIIQRIPGSGSEEADDGN
jgi:sporulation protein YlmC with PRC-barrel domain